MVLMMVLTQLPIMARRAIGWVLAACFSFVAITGDGSGDAPSTLARGWQLATCGILSFHMASSCAISRPRAGEAGHRRCGRRGTGHGLCSRDRPDWYHRSCRPRTSASSSSSRATSAAGWWAWPRSWQRRAGRSKVATGAASGLRQQHGLNEVRYFNPADAERSRSPGRSAWPPPRRERWRRSWTCRPAPMPGQGPDLLEVWISE